MIHSQETDKQIKIITLKNCNWGLYKQQYKNFLNALRVVQTVIQKKLNTLRVVQPAIKKLIVGCTIRNDNFF